MIIHQEFRDLDGKLHNDKGPAFISADGTKGWYQHGLLHRTDGPAIERADGKKWWFVEGKGVSQEEYEEMSFAEYLNTYSTHIDWQGQYHRIDGPAWGDFTGSEMWAIHGEHHRVGGPAITSMSSDQDGNFGYTYEWWQRGRRHREDGPAVEKADGTKQWWLDGELVEPNSPKWSQLLKNALIASIAMCFLMFQNPQENLTEEQQDKSSELQEEFVEKISQAQELLSALP